MSAVDKLVVSALVLVARQKVQRQARGGVWCVPAAGLWCVEMTWALDAFLTLGLIYIVPGTGGRAGLTDVGERVLRDELPPQLHPWVFRP